MPDALWFISALLLLISAVALGTWALFWDRARGRVRCPKCQYRMEGIAAATVTRKGKQLTGHVCPECGTVAQSEKDLRRTYRRWRVVPLVPAMLLASHFVSKVPEIQSRTRRAAVPTPLLVSLWPVDFLIDDPVGSDELASRAYWRWPQPIERLWVNRLCKYQLNELQSAHDPQRPALHTRAYDLRELWPSLHIEEVANWHTSRGCGFAGSSYTYEPTSRDDEIEWERVDWIAETTQYIVDLLSRMIDNNDWDINGGDGGTVFAWGSHIVAIEDETTLEKLDRFLEQFKRVLRSGAGASEQCDYLDPPATIYNCSDLRGESSDQGDEIISKTFYECDCECPQFVIGGSIAVLGGATEDCRERFEASIQRLRDQRKQNPQPK